MKNFLVVGLKTSGIAAAKLLKEVGENVFVFDNDKTALEKARSVCEKIDKNNFVKRLNKKVLSKIDAIVLSPGVESEMWQNVAIKYGIELLSEIEIGFKYCGGTTIAITGTNGKTTTTILLNKILNDSGKKSCAVGNVGTAFCEKSLDIKKGDFAVCETSSFQLENIKDFKPKCVGFLNLKPDHLDRYKTFEEYKKAKENIFKNLSKNDYTILNFDDEIVGKYCFKNGKVLWFSVKQKLPSNFNGAYLQKNFINFVKNNEIIAKFSTKNIKIKGLHNVSNVMCASLLANCVGVEFDSIKKISCQFYGG